MQEFGARTRSALAQAGWSESRVFDTSSYERACSIFGRHAGATARRFLSSFGGLTLHFPHPRIDGAFDTCHFHAEWAASTIDLDTIREYEVRTGSRLSVVGEAFSDHMVLVMDDDGRLFGGYDDLLLKFGETPADAIDCICEGRDGIPVD